MGRIEIPLVGNIKEFMPLKKVCLDLAKSTGAEGKIQYEVGTMIEVPRAALKADELAKEAEFMSFGTNDLTQMTCGFSRDDSAVFLKPYVQKKIYSRDPDSVDFCHRIGLSNVSCSPYRVPIAKLAAAQAAIKHGTPKASSVNTIFAKL